MKKIGALSFVLFLLSAAAANAAGEGLFGGRGRAWETREMGGSTYFGHTRNENLSKHWNSPEGEVRFTQPGRAEGRVGEGNPVIRYYPCPGTQVYPRRRGQEGQ